MAKRFEITLSSASPLASGANLETVVTKLDALLKLHLDAGSALLKPGARRVRIAHILENVAGIRVVRADPTRSLSVALQIPDVPVSYTGDHAVTLRRVEPTFVRTLEAGAHQDLSQIQELFPERVDQARVLNHLALFASGIGESPPVVAGLTGTPLVFREEIAAWARKSIPSANPEEATVNGVVKAGRLGETSRFQIFDGNRIVDVEPDPMQLPTISPFFGKVVTVSGIAEFRPDRSIRRLRRISETRPYRETFRNVIFSGGELSLRTELEFDVEADPRGVEFTVRNETLGIFAFGKTLNEAIEAAKEELGDLWRSIGDAPIEELHDSALPLRISLRNLVASAEVRAD